MTLLNKSNGRIYMSSVKVENIRPLRGLEFLCEVKDYQVCPPATANEIAIIGRSNAGKSSLINALAGEKRLARVSSTPGRTQSLVFFGWKAQTGMIVDLPGYGYAKTSKTHRRQWRTLIESYLLDRSTLRALVLVMDCRRLLTPDEWLLIQLAAARRLAVLVIMSKCDKLGNHALAVQKKKVAAQLQSHNQTHPPVELLTCSTTKWSAGLPSTGNWIVGQLNQVH